MSGQTSREPTNSAASEWSRTVPFRQGRDSFVETWESASDKFQVDVKIGKPLDHESWYRLRSNSEQYNDSDLRQIIHELYGDSSTLEVLVNCPICDHRIEPAPNKLAIEEAIYIECQNCEHTFVNPRPTQTAMLNRFEFHTDLSADYTDVPAINFRLQQVVEPKRDWIIDTYKKIYASLPQTLLDVGAGGGHFVHSARAAGIMSEGCELSQASCEFARQYFGLELQQQNFLEATRGAPWDVVTMWGLLEYVHDPRRFVAEARRSVDPERGLLVLEVPRAASLSTASQRPYDAVIRRHMDPTSHLHAFSDLSAVLLLLQCEFTPVAAWYFGMDAQEFVFQARKSMGDWHKPISAGLLASAQSIIDSAKLSDGFVLAAIPSKRKSM